MLVKKEKLKRFLETKNLFKEKFAALHSGLHGSPFITIQAQRVNLYPKTDSKNGKSNLFFQAG